MVPYGIPMRNVTTMTSSGECHPCFPRERSIRNNPGISQGHAGEVLHKTYLRSRCNYTDIPTMKYTSTVSHDDCMRYRE